MKIKPKLIVYIAFCLVSLIYCGCNFDNGPTKGQPNVILIISDDQSFSDYGFMGHEFIETPHLDKLAKESLTFTRGYATAPLCSPSLASIITGLYAQQHGITGNDPLVEYEGQKSYGKIAPNNQFDENSYPKQRDKAFQRLATHFYKNRLITEYLGDKGYQSFQTGKWWVGSADDAGFDKGMTHGDYNRGGRHGDEGLKIGREGMEPIYDFIENAKANDKPFFIWHAPFLPHTPHNPPKELEEKYLAIAPSVFVAKYWAMVEWFDQTTGELLNYLKEQGLEENTIIVYTCDNGWIQSEDQKGYAPRSKRAPHEAGIRTPIMFKHPSMIKPAFDTTNLVSNIDLVPTILSMLDIKHPELPGINVLDSDQLRNRNVVFAEAYNHDILDIDYPAASILYKVAIERKWKLMVPNNKLVTQSATSRKENIQGYYSKDIQLFDLDTDPNEEINVASKNPGVVKHLTQEIDNWWKPNTR